jgi:hypothetical protein
MATFISYSRDDSDFAVQLARDLRAGGLDVWLDQLDIRTGARWDDEVEKALERSGTFLSVLTPEAIQSQNVKDEIGYAIDAGKNILPIILKPCNVPFRLRRFQYVDFTNKPYDNSLAEIQSLLSSTEDPAAAGDVRSKQHVPEPSPSTKGTVAKEKDQSLLKQTPTPRSGSKNSRPFLIPILILLGVVGLITVFFVIRNSFPAVAEPPSESGSTAQNSLPILQSSATPEPAMTATSIPPSTTSLPPTGISGSNVPVIQSVQLREDTSSGKLVIYQDIYFYDEDGDANYIDYSLVSGPPDTYIIDGPIEIESQKQKSGTAMIGTWKCGDAEYRITLRVMILDEIGNQSNTVEYTMFCHD